MRRSRSDAREDLRRAVRCLPQHTRVAMLEGVRSNDIIVGAYTDRKGGVCPMLAAHRCGGRTDYLAFAHAWDRFTHAKRARRATPHEVNTLLSYLEATLLDVEATGTEDLGAAIAEHQAIARARRESEAHVLGLSWLRRRTAVPADAEDEQRRAPDREDGADPAADCVAVGSVEPV